jgi:hypothetical protein
MPFVEQVASNPTILLLQGSIGFFAALLVFLILFTTRDIILRTHSFFYQLLCIALVALVPILGFFLYLLVRPSRTIRERELYAMVHAFHVKSVDSHHSHKAKNVKKQKIESVQEEEEPLTE